MEMYVHLWILWFTRAMCVSWQKTSECVMKAQGVRARVCVCVCACVYFVHLRILEIFFTLGRELRGEMRG